MMHGEYDVVWSEGERVGEVWQKMDEGKGKWKWRTSPTNGISRSGGGARHEETGATYTHFIPAIKLN